MTKSVTHTSKVEFDGEERVNFAHAAEQLEEALESFGSLDFALEEDPYCDIFNVSPSCSETVTQDEIETAIRVLKNLCAYGMLMFSCNIDERSKKC